MESIPIETTRNPSDDILIIEREEIKGVDGEVPLLFKVGDVKISVLEELLTSDDSLKRKPPFLHESLETISADSIREDYADDQEQANTLTAIRGVHFPQDPLSMDFIRKVWSAFLTFHVFVIPAVIAMILSVATSFASPDIHDAYEDIKYGVMIGFLGASVLVGLPFHMLTLADLEDTVNDIMLHAQMEENNREDYVDSDLDDAAEFPPFF